ncbi:hypothetical protein GQ600_16087 [Phytophthora cactorum]|nr:hypothetical protein GQ600_16087 [Phytophthora cactorum]
MGQIPGDRVKYMLHALRMLDDSEFLLCKTKWMSLADRHADESAEANVREMGETLAMDFTHGTNNLGYHLGAFV